MAFIEACLLHYGLFKYRYLTHVFGMHEKEGIRLIKKYQESSGNQLHSSNAGIIVTKDFHREYLLKSTDPEHFLNLLYTLYNVKSLENL